MREPRDVRQSATAGRPQRTVYDCHGLEPPSNPEQVRAEGEPASDDVTVNEAYVLSRAPAEQARAGAPDRFQYGVTVIAGDRRHRVRLGEREVDGHVRALIDRLERDATPDGG